MKRDCERCEFKDDDFCQIVDCKKGYQKGYSVGFKSGHNQGKADGKEEVLDEVENGLTKLMIMAEENNSLSFSRGHYDLVFTVLADFLDISETRIEEKWKMLKEQKCG